MTIFNWALRYAQFCEDNCPFPRSKKFSKWAHYALIITLFTTNPGRDLDVSSISYSLFCYCIWYCRSSGQRICEIVGKSRRRFHSAYEWFCYKLRVYFCLELTQKCFYSGLHHSLHFLRKWNICLDVPSTVLLIMWVDVFLNYLWWWGKDQLKHTVRKPIFSNRVVVLFLILMLV